MITMSTTSTAMATMIQNRRERCFCRLAARRGASMIRTSRWLCRGRSSPCFAKTCLNGLPAAQTVRLHILASQLHADGQENFYRCVCHARHARYSHQNQLLTAAQPCARLAVPTMPPPLGPAYHGQPDKPLSPASRASPAIIIILSDSCAR